jgi:hypothetical protein
MFGALRMPPWALSVFLAGTLSLYPSEMREVQHREYWSIAEATLLQAGPRFNNPAIVLTLEDGSSIAHWRWK